MYLLLFLVTGGAGLGSATLTVRHDPSEQGLYTRTMDIQSLPRYLRSSTSLLRRAPPNPRPAKKAKISRTSSPSRGTSQGPSAGNRSPARPCDPGTTARVEGIIYGPACYHTQSDNKHSGEQHVAPNASKPISIEGTKFARVVAFGKEHPTIRAGAILTATGSVKAQAVVATWPSSGGGTVFSTQMNPGLDSIGPNDLLVGDVDSPANGDRARVTGGLTGTGAINMRCKGPGADADPSCRAVPQGIRPADYSPVTGAKIQKVLDF